MARTARNGFFVAVAALLGAASGCTASSPSAPSSSSPGQAGAGGHAASPAQLSRVCGSTTLDSPFRYAGAAGPYASGKAGLPTYGTPGSDFPRAIAGVVLPAGMHSYASFQVSPDTVYYLLPGEHIGTIQAEHGDAFVGGLADGQASVLSGNYTQTEAIDSNFSDGNQPGVTIEYLTIQKYSPPGNGTAVNQNANTGWTLRHATLTLNVPGAGMMAGADNTLEHNCMTLNGQYGFQSFNANSWGRDALTGGPYNVTVADNEISYNDTCNFEGVLTNAAIGWSNYNAVPAQYRNPHCGQVTPDGNEGGFKLWETDGVTIKGNYIHHNWGPGVWADTNNANTTYAGNIITDNDGPAIIEEISYNFSIAGNYLANNGWAAGLGNPEFPTPAIYVSESGSDSKFGGIPVCPEASCAAQGSYSDASLISDNVFVNNSGSVFLWQNSNRFCSSGNDDVCTLAGSGGSSKFSMPACRSNLPTVTVDATDYASQRTGSPAADWWNGCLWWSSNVRITKNTIDFNPAQIPHCNKASWPDCGASGLFSEYGSSAPYDKPGGWVIPSQLTFFADDAWSANVYHGPSVFYAWNQGNNDNPVSWSSWTGKVANGDRCTAASERQSGGCTGPFGQDGGSTYDSRPVASPLSPGSSP